jgi:hypothetical protein
MPVEGSCPTCTQAGGSSYNISIPLGNSFVGNSLFSGPGIDQVLCSTIVPLNDVYNSPTGKLNSFYVLPYDNSTTTWGPQAYYESDFTENNLFAPYCGWSVDSIPTAPASPPPLPYGGGVVINNLGNVASALFTGTVTTPCLAPPPVGYWYLVSCPQPLANATYEDIFCSSPPTGNAPCSGPYATFMAIWNGVAFDLYKSQGGQWYVHIPTSPYWSPTSEPTIGLGVSVFVMIDAGPQFVPIAAAAAPGCSVGNTVLVTFNRTVDPVSATDYTKYAISGGPNVVSATVYGQSSPFGVFPSTSQVLLTLDSALSGNYTVTVNGVVDLEGDSTALGAQVSFVATTTPTVVSAQLDTFGNDNVVVTFDRPLDQTSAETFGNYTLVPGGPPNVTSATLLGPAFVPGYTGSRVRLHLSPPGSLTPGVPYSVSVSGVQSACGVAVAGGATSPLFTNTPCGTNGCITFIGGTNKTVPCGSSWHFDPPTNIVDNCCSNYVVNFNSVTNSTNCALIATGYWTITDDCTNVATWTQTVTVVTAPNIVCHPDKTVPCYGPAVFNPPTVTSNACCGTNFFVNVIGPDVTNVLGTCSYSITRTWMIIGCCNTNFCTQKVTMTNAAPIITCATNRTIPCTSNVVFTQPVVNASCCGTNYQIITLGSDITNNLGTCSYSVTRQWLILDCCGHTNFCSQMITVTGALTIVCATNKTIPCTSNVVFTPPSVVAPCCGTNYTVSVLGPDVTTNAGGCAYATTRTWMITDCCGNTNICSQTITVAPPTSYTITLPLGESLIANQLDHGANTADILFPNPTGLRDGDILYKHYNTNCVNGSLTGYMFDSGSPTGFDDINTFSPVPAPVLAPGEGAFYDNQSGVPETVTFTGTVHCPVQPPTFNCPCGTYYLLSYQIDCPGTYQDVTGLSPQEGAVVLRWNGVSYVTYTFSGGSWSPSEPILNVGESAYYSFPCTNGPCSISMTCSTNKSVPCGTIWDFDAPTNIVDTCCSNYTVTYNTITNSGACPLVVTRIWTISDTCGHSTNCSQTVTVTTPANAVCSPLLARAGLTNITVWEQTGASVSHLFPIGSAALLTVAGPSPGVNDFSTTSQEYYDVYISRPDGTPDTNGCCITIVCDYEGPGVNGGVGGNIDSVELNFNTGVTIGASSVGNVQLGGGITDPALLASDGAATSALGLHDAASTRLGTGIGRITVCFPADCNSAKTVGCSDTWSFDPPSTFNSCCSNATINILNTITNGTACTPVITRTWDIIDCCSSHTTCSQTVTVTNAVPAFVSLPSGGYLGCNPVSLPTDSSVRAQVSTTTGCGFVTNVTHVDGGTPCAPTRTFTITASNLCGFASTNVSYSWNADTTPAVIVSAPAGGDLGCNPSFIPTDAYIQSLVVATDNCGTAIVNVSHLDTGTPCAMTRYFNITATDACGTPPNITWVRTYTWKVDHVPPVINCPTKSYTVPLDTNCHLVIPNIPVSGTDNCGGTLTPHQIPLGGTVVSAHSATVTLWLSDSCNNTSAPCKVTVTGVDKTPPVLSGPTTVVVTNCLVPCVTNLVAAHDNCCSPSSLKKTQSPACGTVIGPGINSITVTVTDCNGNSSQWVIHLSVSGQQSFLTNLFNTGVNNSHAILGDNIVDPHYGLPPGSVPGGMPSDYSGNSVAVSSVCHPIFSSPCGYFKSLFCEEYVPWDLSSLVSKWIGPNYVHNGCDPVGVYTYTLNFNVPPTLNPATASISGRWAADETAGMYLNGTPVPAINGGVALGSSSWTKFTIPSSLGFAFANTLTFKVTNYHAFTGLRVEFTNAFANCYTCAPPAIISITSSHSVPKNGVAALSVAASGTPPLSYQWYYNGTQLQNGGKYSGVKLANLVINPINFGDAGLYTVVISNACGSVTGKVSLTVTPGLAWPWGWWNVAQLANPLAATFGPDLALVGSDNGTNYSISSGTTEDFGLPTVGGQIANVMHVDPLPSDTSLQIPLIAPPGSNSVSSYTVILDLNEPGAGLGTPTTLIRNSCCLGSSGQDGVELTLDSSNYLHIDGFANGAPFDIASTAPMPVDTWTRLALVVDDPQDGVPFANLALYEDGQSMANVSVAAVPGLGIDWNSSAPTLLSRQTNDALNAEVFVSSAQFHAVALDSQTIASMGSPDAVPTPSNDTSAGDPPPLSVSYASGLVVLSWTGSPYVLQETDDLASDDWSDSATPFTVNQFGPDTITTAVANPMGEGPTKFYRLVFRP